MYIHTARIARAFVVLVCFAIPVSGFAVQAVPSDDAYIDRNSSSNFGNKEELRVGDSGKYTGLIRFDLSGLPGNVTGDDIASATLKLFVSKVNKTGSFDVLAVLSDWSEGGVRWSNRPALDTIPQGIVAVSGADAQKYILVDLTGLVMDWVDGVTDNHGIALAPIGNGIDVQFDSRESKGTSHDARLEIVLASTGGGQGLPGEDGQDGEDGCSVLNGAGAPDATFGKDCDFYIDTDESDIYGPKTEAAWGDPTSLIGPQGQQGEQGEQGTQGIPGLSGWQRVAGTSGNFGANKYQTGSATCTGDRVVLGGGVTIGHTGGNLALVTEKVHISTSGPSADNTWTARLWSQDQQNTYTFQVFALCAFVES